MFGFVHAYAMCFRSSLTCFADFVSLSFVIITLPQTARLFYISLHSQASQQYYTMLSFSLMQRHGYSYKQTSPHALGYYTVGIPFVRRIDLIYSITLWAYLLNLS